MQGRLAGWHVVAGLAALLAIAVPANADLSYVFAARWGSPGGGAGQFDGPYDVAVDSLGDVYVPDTNNHRVQKFSSTGALIGEWGSMGSRNGQFIHPEGVAVDADGRVYVSDTDNHRIQKFDADGGFIRKWGTWGDGDGQFSGPTGVAVDRWGDVYVTDQMNHRVQKFDSKGTFLAKWGSNGTGEGEFDQPVGVDVDRAGNVYVVDVLNRRIQKFDSGGTFLGQWGAFGYAEDQFVGATGVGVDRFGNVHVVDNQRRCILEFDPSGTYLGTWCSPGSGDGELDLPLAVAFADNGRAYVADYGNDRIQVFMRAGLEWVKAPGYRTDGVDPDRGDPDSTTFTFKVRYTDTAGGPPRVANCLLREKPCGRSEWFGDGLVLNMTQESGDTATGAVYSVSTNVPNNILAYRFRFRTAAGVWLAGTPAALTQGPVLSGKPQLCWSGRPGFSADGVDPDSGVLPTRFRFQVRYRDQAGTPPTTAELVLRRDGAAYLRKPLTPTYGSYRLGKTYQTSVVLREPGAYEYRFDFRRNASSAVGAPASYQAGPTIAGAAALAVAGLTAMPTHAGAQVTFTLSGAAEVTATVVNAAGRSIRTIACDRPLAAGVQTLLWDRRADTGLPVPSGLYLVKVTARSAEGTQNSAVATIIVR